MRKRAAILICIIIAAANILGLILMNVFYPSNLASAEKGVLSLKGTDFEKQKRVRIGGVWEFYPGELITPSRDRDVFKDYAYLRKLVEVPEDWENYETYSMEAFRTGTFRLTLELPEDGSYGVIIDGIRWAGAVFMNGTKVSESDRVSVNTEEIIPDIKRTVGIEGSVGKKMELVIQVVSSPGYSGGMIHWLEFGTAKEILRHRDMSRRWMSL